jgi:hypothetical protein
LDDGVARELLGITSVGANETSDIGRAANVLYRAMATAKATSNLSVSSSCARCETALSCVVVGTFASSAKSRPR